VGWAVGFTGNTVLIGCEVTGETTVVAAGAVVVRGVTEEAAVVPGLNAAVVAATGLATTELLTLTGILVEFEVLITKKIPRTAKQPDIPAKSMTLTDLLSDKVELSSFPHIEKIALLH